jgi:PadR family transcriptional regulator PadR
MRGHHSRTGHGFHGPLTGRMRGFVQPWLLLLLADSPAHGYQLLERLNQNEDTRGIDPGLLYRTLRQFEEDGLVKSSWDNEGSGAARRVYEVTADGIGYLDGWIEHVHNIQAKLARLIDRYESFINIHTRKKGGEQDG